MTDREAIQVGRLEALWLKPGRGAEMEPISRARADDGGLVGNLHRGGRRQVTVVALEAWRDAEAELGTAVPPEARRANLLIRGIDLKERRGHTLAVGGAHLEITGETKPCRRMDQAQPGLKDALEPDWRGGVLAHVVREGEISVGDEVRLLPPDPGVDLEHLRH